MKNKFAWMALGSLVTILIMAMFTFFTSYERNVDSMLGAAVTYKKEYITTHFSSDACAYLTHAKKRTWYFGELPPQEDAIEIIAPGRATFYVYPSDEDSVIIRYEPHDGISRTYLKSGYGDFNRILEVFYELTDNEVFNQTVEYDS